MLPFPKKAPPPPPPPTPAGRPRLYLVDGPNMAFRAHYAIRGLSNSRGEPTNALFGFTAMLLQLLKDERPDYLAVAWDPKGDVFRNRMYPEYKANRSETPEDLKKQFPRFPEIVRGLGVPYLVLPDFEADDVIGTLVVRYKDRFDITIVSGDKDLMQLVQPGGRVVVLDTMKGLRSGPAEVKERWGVWPHQIIDILAIMGDSSDNIPGVLGIGEKGAAQLISEWGSMEGVFSNLEKISGRYKKALLAPEARASADLSYRLATIDTQVPIEVHEEELRVHFPPKDRGPITLLLQELEFHRFLQELGGAMKTVSDEKYRCVTTEAALLDLARALEAAQLISFDTETTSIQPTQADLVGLSFCVEATGAVYVPVGHTGPGSEAQLPRARVLDVLGPILRHPDRRFVGQHLKYDKIVLRGAGWDLGPIVSDTMIADYLLNPTRRAHGLDNLALTWLGHKMTSFDEATKDSPGEFARVPLDRATAYSAEDSHVAFLLHEKMRPVLDEQGLSRLYDEVEIPLIPVLASMEEWGIGVDVDQLRAYGEELGRNLVIAEQDCWAKAGQEFNTASPKQLAEILFEKLGLPVVKKTKTGPSTDADVLEELAAEHALPAAILRFRSLQKLKSTYVDAIPPLVNPRTGRVHTSYHQAVAATGRLSSTDPNLQNIPIRTPDGRRIRQAFIPAPGFVFLSADYNQIELRVLAHLCYGEGGFARAFREGQDVHRATAAEVFDVALPFVTAEMRRTAKAINFGLVYGQTAHGLSRTLHIGQKDAKGMIERYKAKYPEIDQYMARVTEEAKSTGSVTTLLGRKRPIPDLDSPQFNLREAARRTAINTPVQGSAADLIKVAMLRVWRRLAREAPEVRMILQVHDELVFEVPEALLDRTRATVVEEMESVHVLAVPLRVDTGVGRNWDEAH